MDQIKTLADFEKCYIVYKPFPKDPAQQVCQEHGTMLFNGKRCNCIRRARENYWSLKRDYAMYRALKPKYVPYIFGQPAPEPQYFRFG